MSIPGSELDWYQRVPTPCRDDAMRRLVAVRGSVDDQLRQPGTEHVAPSAGAEGG